MAVLGRVEAAPIGLPWRVIFPDAEHLGATSYLRELAASDCSPLTVRSYAFDLLRWFRFLHERLINWERAERVDVRAFVEYLRETPNPQRLRRGPDRPPPGSVNALTGKSELPGKYAARTINHQLSVLFGFYDHACAANLGPRPNWIRGQGRRIDVTGVEDDGFWCWAVAETLRHGGIRVEELMELTQLSLRHCTASTTGTLVPLLHIVPSKTDCERLVPMTPELVQVLLAVMRRAKGGHDHVPLSVRYDVTEKVHGQPFPHLFSRKVGARQEVLSGHYLRGILGHLAVVAGLSDAGQPIRFTPHDFRRLFATDAVNGGLPLHIAAALLGHLNLDTTRGYTAVFPEHLITAHQAFIERRRQLRPIGEDRVAEDDEWAEFEQHFLLRRVALGECHRPYGTPCVHEHACTRCRFLRVDPAQLGRINEMTENAEERLVEAKDRAWLGEVAALEESLKHLRIRQFEAQQRLSHGSNPFRGAETRMRR